ncbi:hypothetical protein LDO26_06070 [Luteimonas sp. BDR2-5]|uniref:hypothetical protein n=1 Tax=Proluteimonas luteida TaxID=2878685 RepID=UPI001E2FFA42|nr:hypothetical protein [Luteimonas sp. BDR2-5]MCD9027768.1 hypothetical protein [Luteimonas sp. BDR2-5]
MPRTREPGPPPDQPPDEQFRQELQSPQDGAAGAQDAVLDAFHATFQQAPYYSTGRLWDDYAPAYRYGLESFLRHSGQRFEAVQAELANNWRSARGASRLGWVEARGAVEDAWRSAEAASRQRGDDGGQQVG